MLPCTSFVTAIKARRFAGLFPLIAFFLVTIGSDGAPAQEPANPPPSAAASSQSDAKKTDDAAAAPKPAITDPRQAQILADTQKLLKLSQELKAEVAKSNKDMLSLAVIKKAEEVEKLAKTLKEELSKPH
jgi:hypothetical protein